MSDGESAAVRWLNSTASKTRWIVGLASAAVLLWRRDEATVLCLTGAIVNALLSKVLKRLVNEARPEGARLADPGMPSSHAQSLCYFAVYLSMVALDAPALPLPSLQTSPWLALHWSYSDAPLLRAAVVAALAAYAGGSAAWRVAVGLHTPAQIGVGAGIGGSFGAVWLRWVQPALAQLLSQGSGVTSGAVMAVIVVGALTILSVERWLSTALKKGS